jgi:hypothetical protein
MTSRSFSGMAASRPWAPALRMLRRSAPQARAGDEPQVRQIEDHQLRPPIQRRHQLLSQGVRLFRIYVALDTHQLSLGNVDDFDLELGEWRPHS